MALDEAPPFWWKKNAWQAWLASPVSYVFGQAAAARMDAEPGHAVDIPVICVGNFVAGGGGKTPTVQMLVRYLQSQKMKPGILSRGHGGAITSATLVNLEQHNAHDVGDEALLHAAITKTVVSADRPKGAEVLQGEGCNIIIMDDGFQNPSLKKDYRLVVIDTKRGLGNGFPMPSGPLRVPLKRQLQHADAILMVDGYDEGYHVVRKMARAGKPVFHASSSLIGRSALKGKPVLAFAGIADPSKFFDSLEKAGAKLVDRQGYGDHHVFSEEECGDLIDRAKRQDLQLVTTTKDHVRLQGMGKAQEALAERSEAIRMQLIPENPAMLDIILKAALKSATERRLLKRKEIARNKAAIKLANKKAAAAKN
jgi:tetraacyldisaccharide 4'-kinase